MIKAQKKTMQEHHNTFVTSFFGEKKIATDAL
jgi:hypothetical protein